MNQREELERDDLAFRAKTARMKAGETQAQAAERFEVHKQTIWNAENNPSKSLDQLRIDMIETYEGVKIRQVYVVEPAQ